MSVNSTDSEERAFWTRQAQKQLEAEQEHARDALRQERLGAEAFIRRDTTAWARQNTGGDGRLAKTADLRELDRIVEGRMDALLGKVRGDGACPPEAGGRDRTIVGNAQSAVAAIGTRYLDIELELAADLAAGTELSAPERARLVAHISARLRVVGRAAR